MPISRTSSHFSHISSTKASIPYPTKKTLNGNLPINNINPDPDSDTLTSEISDSSSNGSSIYSGSFGSRNSLDYNTPGPSLFRLPLIMENPITNPLAYRQRLLPRIEEHQNIILDNPITSPLGTRLRARFEQNPS